MTTLASAIGRAVGLSGNGADNPACGRIRAILLLGSLPILASCSSFRTEVGLPLTQPSTAIVEGETQAHTVIHELGPPHALSPLPDGFVFLYEHSKVSEFQFGISLDFLHLPFFKVIKADSDLSETVQVFTFDRQGVLRARGSAGWREKLGGGGALQLIISALSLTDTTAFRRLPDPLLWGRGQLQRPPVTLNAAQDLRSGAHGLQQRLAPVFVGQATLEMSRPKPLKSKRQKTRR